MQSFLYAHLGLGLNFNLKERGSLQETSVDMSIAQVTFTNCYATIVLEVL